MSFWTQIIGVIKVAPRGNSQPEKEYVLKSVLAHLPRVTGSEGNMEVYINQVQNYTSSRNFDEFGQLSNLGDGRHGSFEVQSYYLITINANLRDRWLELTHKEFSKWIIRLSKRVMVEDITVNITEGSKKITINDAYPYYQIYDGSWIDKLFDFE